MIVNHVMSNDVQSGIFADIMNYNTLYAPMNVDIVVSEKPIEHADVYHYHRPHLEKQLKSNSVCTVHHDLTETDPWLVYEKFHDIYSSAGKIICLNSNQKSFLSQKNINNTVVIPHGYNDNIFSKKVKPKIARKNQKVILGIVSKRYGRKVKGEEYIYELAKRLNTDDFGFILVGQGRGYDANILRNLGFDVQLFEYLPYITFESLYEKIDVLLMTSFYEGGPANIPEAICTGTPVAGNNIGMITDFVRHKVNGIYLTQDPDLDVYELREMRVNLDKYFKRSMSMIHQAITWEQNVKKHMSVYNEIAKFEANG